MTESLILLFVCLIGSGFFSGMETGVVSINRLRLHHMVRSRRKNAATLQHFSEDSNYLLGTTLIGTNLCNNAFTVVGTSLGIALLGHKTGTTAAFIACTLIILVCGEYLPKAWFQSNPTTRTLRYIRPLNFFGNLFKPITFCLIWLTEHLPGTEPDQDKSYLLSREELQRLVSQPGEASAYLSAQKKRMIHEVFQLSTRTCKDIMVPRNSMRIIKQNTTVPEMLDLARELDMTRFPVYSTESNQFVGLLNILDIIEDPNPEHEIRDFIRPPQFVPEDLPADDLIPRMRLTRQPMLLVRNTRGEVTGFITTEVVLAELVGHLL